MTREKIGMIMVIAALFVMFSILSAYPAETTNANKAPFIVRDLSPITNHWVNAISYSPYRNGQSPDTDVFPSYEQVKEDLDILRKHWGLIRIYAADPVAETVLSVIRNEKYDLKVFLGAWICQFRNVNDTQVSNVIDLANRYRDLVPAVVVGNEVLVRWSDHSIELDDMVQYIRQVRSAIAQPVSMADNYEFWLTPAARTVAEELDFITIHNYPLWDNKRINEAMVYTKAYYQSVRNKLPERYALYGEVGWATKSDNSYMVKGQANESNQTLYYKKVIDWASNNNVISFYFDAFDERWKRSLSDGPNDPEKHWGLFTADRKAKPAVTNIYPELVADVPVSNAK
jgi:exo-beta-1,3-glucanase (GH17 family)